MSSFLTLRTPIARSSRFPSSRKIPASTSLSRYSGFHSSPVRTALSENDRHHELAAEENEKHKNDSLQKQKDGKGEWKRELASTSESAIKADKEEIEASEVTIKQMQKETEEYLKKR